MKIELEEEKKKKKKFHLSTPLQIGQGASASSSVLNQLTDNSFLSFLWESLGVSRRQLRKSMNDYIVLPS
jgi:hypothetical protein